MRIAFHSNQLGLRGTEVAMFDYAYYNERLLGNGSVIIANRNPTKLQALDKFSNKFKIYFYDNPSEISGICSDFGVDILYAIKAGDNDGIVSKSCKTVVHSVFQTYQPHGNVYAYVSEWLAGKASNGKCPWVPHMVNMAPYISGKSDMRSDLDIPKDAFVFGYHGGSDSFDIGFVQSAIDEYTSKKSDVFFIFMNVEPFMRTNKQVIFLPGESNLQYKSEFIRTCDAMLHARSRGETFGLSIAEFSAMGKPVVTFLDSPERQHIDILQDKGIYYQTPEHIKYIIENARDVIGSHTKDLDVYSKRFSPESVMAQFNQVFIKS